MVAIAVDRYLCICHPWLSAQLMNQSRAKVVVMSLALFAAVIGVCVSLMYGVNRPVDLPINYRNLTIADLTAIIQSADKYVITASSLSSSSAAATAAAVVLLLLSPVSIQTQSLALRALRK